MTMLKSHIKNTWITAYNSIDAATLKDIYAFSFFVYDIDDDPRYPSLVIGYNTLSNYKTEITNAFDAKEAKWNYAFWLQNEIGTIGDEEDSKGAAIINTWITELELNYTDEEEDEDFENCMDKGSKITAHFVDALIAVVKESHDEQLTDKPILIHELEYYDAISNQNIIANGKERVAEFCSWIEEMGM